MVDDKMLCGLLQNKENGEDLLMARIGQENHEQFQDEPGASPMNFTGRSMRGFLFVGAEGIDRDSELEKWIERCLAYNPIAKSSKK
ncbi:RNA methyltransferase [Crocinitomix sp.]|nr:RNA methyltransferase [Crocinitomix sp.]